MGRARPYLIAAAPAVLSLALARIAPADGLPVAGSDGVCCIEPGYYFAARVIGELSPLIVAACALWLLAIWWRSRPR